MCCIKINTETFMALLTNAVIQDERKEGYSFKVLKEYVQYMESAAPTYVITDFDLQAVNDVIKKYDNIFKKKSYDENDEYDFKVVSGEYKPNMDYFLSVYNVHWQNYLKRMANDFWTKKVDATEGIFRQWE